jgi:hypothetical protein
MKKIVTAFILAACLASGIWLALPNKQEVENSSAPDAVSMQRTRKFNSAKHQSLLDRVRSVAQNRLPDVDFTQHEKTVFSQVDEKIDELEVMEILLAVETEFDVDISESRINDLVGIPNRRALREHLSLSLLAELLEGLDPSKAH